MTRREAVRQARQQAVLLSRITQLEAALRSILTESGVTDFDDEEPTGTIHRIAYMAKTAL